MAPKAPLALVTAALLLAWPARADRVLFDRPSVFGRVVVTERSDGLRVLSFGDAHEQSAQHPGRPDALVYEYVQVMAAAPAFVPSPRRVLLVGIGGGTIPSFLLRHFPKMRVDAVDIDPVVVDVAYRFFDMPRSPRLRAHVGDGRRFVEKAKGRYDLILLDAYGPGAIPVHLATQEFLETVRGRLAPRGAVVANLHWSAPDYPGMLRAYQEAFPNVYVVTPPAQPASRVIVAYATPGEIRREAVVARLGEWTRAFRLPFDFAEAVKRGLTAAPERDPRVRPLRDEPSTR